MDRIAGRIERAEQLDPLSKVVAGVVDKVLASRRVTELASGTPIGHPLHPLLVTVPIGSWTSSMIFDLTGNEDLQRKGKADQAGASVKAKVNKVANTVKGKIDDLKK